MAKVFLLARHASAEPAYAGRYIGRSDVGLAGWMETEFHRLARAAWPYKPTAIVSSPLRRARLTAEGVARQLEFPADKIQIMADLREIDFGRWDGMRFEDIARADPEIIAQWAAWSEDFRFPAGERIDGFLHRVGLVTDELKRMADETILVVTHGGVIRAMICQLLGLAPKNYLVFDVRPAGLTLLKVFDRHGLLVGLNLGIEEME